MNPKVLSPSLMTVDFCDLKNIVDVLNQADNPWIHLDVMDGVFVPNISFGFPIIESLSKHTPKVLDIHLMIVSPEQHIERFARIRTGSYITVHLEACVHLHRTIQQIKELGAKAGVAINPHTPVSMLDNILDSVDMVNIMSVNPGFGGQKFIESTYEKVRLLKEKITAVAPDVLIQVDGGVSEENAEKLVQMGADVLITGSACFNSPDPKQFINSLQSRINQ